MNNYLEMKERHQEEVNNFPMFFAYNEDQFNKGMKKLGLDPKDTKKIIAISAGGFIQKSNEEKFLNMFEEHEEEMRQAISDDKTGEGFIFDMFRYELANHEYIVTWDYTDTFEALNLTTEEVQTNKKLLHGLARAKKDYLEGQKELI